MANLDPIGETKRLDGFQNNPAALSLLQALQSGSLAGSRAAGDPVEGARQTAIGDGFEASPELQEDQQAQQTPEEQELQQKLLELMKLEMQRQQQLQSGDQEGAAQTQARIAALLKELGMGTGQDQAAPADQAGGDGVAAAPIQGGGAPMAAGAAGAPGAAGVAGPSAGGGTSAGGDSGTLNAPVSDAGGASVDVSKELEPGGAAGIPDKYKDNEIAQLIWQESKKAGADPYVMLATAVVESGLNPKAVGDNGTSFGLYQYHIGGALGDRSKEWAFNPKNIIQDEAQRFAKAGVKDGAGAAAVQRPADPSGYAVKVNNVIADMKKG